MHFFAPKFFWTPIMVKIESKISVLGEKKICFLHRQMTEQLSFEVDEKIVKKSEKVHFFKYIFCSKTILDLKIVYPT